MQLSLGSICFLLWGLAASADPISTRNSTVRALGMGDAFTALADDGSSLLYNPAGLARVVGVNWKVFSIKAEGSGYEAIDDLQGFNDEAGSGFSETIGKLYGDHLSAGAGASTWFYAPMIGIGAYNHLEAVVDVNNPVYPELNTSVLNDFVYVLGFGIPASPFFHTGLNLKYIKRTGAVLPFGPGSVADLDPEVITGQITEWGTGYGVDVGANFRMPTPIFSATFSAVWRNVGGIEFKSETGSEIPSEPNDITLGVGLAFDTPIVSVTPAVDFRYLNSTEYQLTRKINFGVEINFPLLDIRGGFREGYYTAGAGVNLGLFNVDVATYGVELGEYPGQLEDRRYALEFTMEIGVGLFSAKGSGSGAASGTKGGKGAGAKSIWGSRKLKQRR